MENQPKHHYRAVFKSDHLGSADLEDYIEQGRKLVFVIKEVRQEMGAKVAGKKGNFNIAYFTDPSVKPLVLNVTNSKQIKTFAGGNPFVETWQNIPVELYVDENVKAVTGGTTQGVRIKPVQPIIGEKPKPPFVEANFENAKKASATVQQIRERYELSPEMEQKYLAYVTT